MAEEEGEEVFRRGLNRICALCGEGLHVEHGRTKFQSLAEAVPHLKRIEAANLATRRMLESIRQRRN
jgi:hypothetical protein